MKLGGTSRYVATLALAIRFTLELWWLKHSAILRGARQGDAAARLYVRQARQFTTFARRMGGLIVKLGQFMSVRIDLLPKPYIDELSRLQDCLPAVPTADLVAVIEAELGKPLEQVYATFDRTPLAAASLGQVHRATLPEGGAVAVKVLRPGIDDLVRTDLRSLRTILRLVDRATGLGQHVDIDELFADFESTFTDELDYESEGHHAEAFAANLRRNRHVQIPHVFWEYSTRRVLTCQYMDGCRVDDLAAIDAAGFNRHGLAVNLAGLFFEMVLGEGLYHADPHPGNVFVRADGVIQLIDFGMVGTVTSEARADYAQLVQSLVKRDAAGIVRGLKSLKFLGPGADTRQLARLIEPSIDALVGDATGFYTSAPALDALMTGKVHLTVDSATLAELQRFIFTQPITLPGKTTFLGKALITVVGLCLRLDPDLDLLATAAPFVVSSPTSLISHWWNQAVGDGTAMVQGLIPTTRRLMSTVERLDDGSFQAEIGAQVARQLAISQRRQNRRLTRLVVGGLGLLALVVWRRR